LEHLAADNARSFPNGDGDMAAVDRDVVAFANAPPDAASVKP
jgi:hypothetical protein